MRVSIVLPTYNERENVAPLIKSLFTLGSSYDLEIIIVDDNSTDGTINLIKEMSLKDNRIRLIRRVGRHGLASAIKEGLLDATGDFAAVMDSDGQHEPTAIFESIEKLEKEGLDLVAGSRFVGGAEIHGLSSRRQEGSSFANSFARMSLNKRYRHLTDFMSGCFVMDLNKCLPLICKVDVHGFKFLYELLAISEGKISIKEVPLQFQPRIYGNSKLDIAVLWDFLISLMHAFSLRLIPRRAISFGIVGASGVFVQLCTTKVLMSFFLLQFENAIPISVITAATSNYLINNALTFRAQRLKNWFLIKGLIKFLLVASLPVIANVGLATSFYQFISNNAIWAQLSGIIVVFVWNYAASSRFVWNTP